MATTTYTHQVSETANGKVDVAALEAELRNTEITIALDGVSLEYNEATGLDEIKITYKDVLDADDVQLKDAVVAAHTGEPLEPDLDYTRDDEGRMRVAIERTKEGLDRPYYVPNFCDPCVWYQGASQVVGEALVDSGDGLTFASAHQYWIDLRHGRLCKEGRLANQSGYTPVIKADGVALSEREPFADSGGDYVVDYDAGTVTFAASQAGKTITADYYHANLSREGSTFTFGPGAGKKLWLVRAEVQFSADAVMRDTIVYQAFAYDPTNPSGPKIPVDLPHEWKTVRDLLDESNGSFPVVQPMGGAQRGLVTEAYVFPFDYSVMRELKASQGVEVRMWLNKGAPMGGDFCTVTFYCTELDE